MTDITRQRLGKLIIIFLVLLLVGNGLRLLFVEQATSAAIFPLPEDKNRRNNFVANPQAWMVDDRLHLSFRHKTMQVSDSDRFRRLNGKRMLATATKDFYLYAYLDDGESNFLVNNIVLVRRSDGRVVHRAKHASDSFLDESNLYYITTHENQYRLVRYNLSTGALEELMPWVTSFCVLGDTLLYTTGGAACDYYAPLDTREPLLWYRNLQTGADELLLNDIYEHGISDYLVDGQSIYFTHDNAIFCFDDQIKAMDKVLDIPEAELLNIYNGKMYLSYQTYLGVRSNSYDIRCLDMVTGVETAMFPQPLETGPLSPTLSILDDGVWVVGSTWHEVFVIEKNGMRYILQ